MGHQAEKDGADFAPAELVNPAGTGPFLLVCEHASNHIPAALNTLGLSEETRHSHVAWDPGAAGVADRLATLLDAPLVKARISRLVYDCNRPPEAASAMPARVERYDIPGNTGLSAAQRAARVAQVYEPFRSLLAQTIADRPTPPVLVTIHSFTPVYLGTPRKVEIGILHDSDSRLADAMLARADTHTKFITGRNDPYGPEDGVTHTLRLHGIENGLLNVMIEIRNDLITDDTAQAAMAALLAGLLRDALSACAPKPSERTCSA